MSSQDLLSILSKAKIPPTPKQSPTIKTIPPSKPNIIYNITIKVDNITYSFSVTPEHQLVTGLEYKLSSEIVTKLDYYFLQIGYIARYQRDKTTHLHSITHFDLTTEHKYQLKQLKIPAKIKNLSVKSLVDKVFHETHLNRRDNSDKFGKRILIPHGAFSKADWGDFIKHKSFNQHDLLILYMHHRLHSK